MVVSLVFLLLSAAGAGAAAAAAGAPPRPPAAAHSPLFARRQHISDGSSSGSSVLDSDDDQMGWVLAQLKLLPPLAKPHVSRPACWYMGGPLSPAQRGVLREYARVLRVQPLCGYSHEADGPCTEAKINREVNATFTTMISPWYAGFWNASLPPTWTGPEEASELNATKFELASILSQLQGCNATSGMLGSILIDNERFWVRGPADPLHVAWNAAVDRKNNLVYDMVKSFFPDTHVEWFGRGAVRHSENDQGAGTGLSGTTPGNEGWLDCPYFSLRERGDSLGVSLYTVPEIGCESLCHVSFFSRRRS
jgi:hypothetical protein